MDICFLGTAPGLPLPDRFGQTIVVTTPDPVVNGATNPYLLDVGDGASSLLARHGFDHRAIRAVVISHMHADHHGGLAQVVKTSMHLRRRDELVILAPAEGIPALRAYLTASYLHDDWLGYPIRWESLADIAAGDGIDLPGFMRLTTHPNEHLASARERVAAEGPEHHTHAFESYSMTLEHAGVRVVYSGNLHGPCGADEMSAYVDQSDLLICELAHLDPIQLGRFLGGKRIVRTVLAHIHPKWQSTPDSNILDLVRAGAADNGILGELLLARDGDVCKAVPNVNAALHR